MNVITFYMDWDPVRYEPEWTDVCIGYVHYFTILSFLFVMFPYFFTSCVVFYVDLIKKIAALKWTVSWDIEFPCYCVCSFVPHSHWLSSQVCTGNPKKWEVELLLNTVRSASCCTKDSSPHLHRSCPTDCSISLKIQCRHLRRRESFQIRRVLLCQSERIIL